MNIQEIEDQYLIPLYAKRDIALVRGDGCFLFDENDNKYLDLTSNYGASLLGYNNTNYNQALKKQLDNIANAHNSFYSDTRANFLKKLHSIIPQEKSFLCSTGTESVEAGIKFARIATEKTGIISAKMGYHGRTMGALSATAIPKYQKPFLPLIPEFKHVAFNNIEDLEENLDENTAGVILEPIQGESGVVIPDKDYFKKIKELCEKNNSLLIMDEVQTGFRTGNWLVSDYFGVKADILCLSKGLGNGFPVAITAVTKEVSDNIPKGAHGTTFGANPLACCAGLATLQEIEDDNLLNNSKEVGEFLLHELQNLESPLIREVRGLGLMIAIELKQRVTPYVRELQEKGVLVMLNGNIMRILPPITISKQEAEMGIEKIKQVLC